MSTISTAATASYLARRRELPQQLTPACHGHDPRLFDGETFEQLEQARAICMTCPLFAVCDAEAAATRPTAGVWAGVRWKRKRGTVNGSPVVNPERYLLAADADEDDDEVMVA